MNACQDETWTYVRNISVIMNQPQFMVLYGFYADHGEVGCNQREVTQATNVRREKQSYYRDAMETLGLVRTQAGVQGRKTVVVNQPAQVETTMEGTAAIIDRYGILRMQEARGVGKPRKRRAYLPTYLPTSQASARLARSARSARSEMNHSDSATSCSGRASILPPLPPSTSTSIATSGSKSSDSAQLFSDAGVVQNSYQGEGTVVQNSYQEGSEEGTVVQNSYQGEGTVVQNSYQGRRGKGGNLANLPDDAHEEQRKIRTGVTLADIRADEDWQRAKPILLKYFHDYQVDPKRLFTKKGCHWRRLEALLNDETIDFDTYCDWYKKNKYPRLKFFFGLIVKESMIDEYREDYERYAEQRRYLDVDWALDNDKGFQELLARQDREFAEARARRAAEEEERCASELD